MAGMGTDLLSQMLNMGSMQRGIEGQQLQEPYEKWQFSQPWANKYLQNFLGTTLSQPGMDYYTTGGGGGAMSQLMPAIGAFAGSESGSESLSKVLDPVITAYSLGLNKLFN